MVEEQYRQALRQAVEPASLSSRDSAPPRLTRPVSSTKAPQVLAVGAVVGFLLVLLVNRVPAVDAFFPEGDFYFSRYSGEYVVPIRIFIISFYIAYSSAIDAPWSTRVRLAIDFILPFALFAVVIDLCNALLVMLTGAAMPLDAIGIVMGLFGFLLFAIVVLNHADMPPRNEGPLSKRYHVRSLIILVLVIALALGLSLWAVRLDLPLINRLRNVALLGGVSIGFFLFVPLVFFLLNVLAAIQALVRRKPPFSPDISLVIPCLNESKAIGVCIAAVDRAAAAYRGKVTLIIVDNNSSDDTPAVAGDALAACRHLTSKLITETKPGKARALNAGFALVTTEYFARLDADTLLNPDSLSRGFLHFSDPHVGCVGGLALPPGRGPYDGPRLIEVLLRAGYDQVGLGAADVIVGIPGMFACYRTDVARAVGGFAYGMNGEDTDMSLRIGEAGYRLISDPQLTVVSEVPRTFYHLREQRLRWYRTLYHVLARNRQLLDGPNFSVRGWIVFLYLLMNTARRAMGWPLILFAINFLLMYPDPRSTMQVASVLAVFLGAPLINAVIAVIVNLRFWALLHLPSYIVFRMFRYYFTLESALSLTYDGFTRAGKTGTAAHRDRWPGTIGYPVSSSA